MSLLFIKDFYPTTTHEHEINTLLSASENDKLTVVLINNRGGLVTKGIELDNAIIKSKATIEVVATGTVQSTGAVVWSMLCTGQSIRVTCRFNDKNSKLLFHKPQKMVNEKLTDTEDLSGEDKKSSEILSELIKLNLKELLIKRPDLKPFKACGIEPYNSLEDISTRYDKGEFIILRE